MNQQEQVELLSFADVLMRLHAQKHTGPVTIHFAEGHPQAIEIPKAPERIVLDRGARAVA